MSASEGNERLVKDVGYLKGRFDSMKEEIVEIKVTQNRIFDKIDDGQKEMFEKIDLIHCKKESVFEDIDDKLEKLEKTTYNGVKEKAIAKGWLIAMEWFIKIGLVIIGIVIAYKTYTVT